MKRLKRKNIVTWKHVWGGFDLVGRTQSCKKSRASLVLKRNGVGAGSIPGRGRAASLKDELDSEFILVSCLVLFSLCSSTHIGGCEVKAEPWSDSCSFLLSVWTSYAFWESEPFNSCGLADENQLSILNRQNLSKLGQCPQIIFNHFSNSIKSGTLFLKRRVSKL